MKSQPTAGNRTSVQENSPNTVLAPLYTRIAWVAPSLDRGWRWQTLLKEFSGICPNTVVFTGLWPGFTKGFEGTFKIKKLTGFRYVNVGKSEMGYPKRFMWVSPRSLLDLLRFRPEIILTNGFHLCTLYALLVKAILHCRLVLLWQGISPETGGAAGSFRLKFRRLVAHFFDLAVCNTRSGIRYLEDLVGLPQEKVIQFVGEVADRWSFISENGSRKSMHSTKRPAFLFVGRLIRAKGVDRLLRACSLLVERGVEDFSLVLVGKGPHEDEFRELSHKYGIDNHVRWEGFVPYESIGPYYEACDVFVLPSLEDTWGVVALEAMSFGKSVVCSRFAGSSELVQHGVNGYIFDPDKPEELANYLMQFIYRPELIERYGRAAQEFMARHTPRHAASQLSQILHQAMQTGATTTNYESAWRDS